MLSFRRPPIGSTRLDRRADTKHIFPKRAVWFLALWIALPLFAPAHALEPVTLQLKWTHQFQFAGYYAALEKGYYREAGLEVKLAEAMPGQSAVDAVLENKAEFGVGTSELLLLRMRGKPVVVLGVIMQHSPIALLSHGPPRIQNIQDLAGRSIMIEPGSAELFAMLRREKLPDNASLRIESHNFDVRDVIKGRVDAMSVYVTDELYEVERQGIPHLLFRPLTSGIDFYGDNLFTTEAQIRDHPERVKAFRAASLKGWKYAMENPAEIIRLIRERYSRHKTQEHLEFEAAAMARLMQVGLIEPGYMYPGRWQHIADTYAEVGMIDRAADLKGFLYENDPAADHAWLYKSLGATLAGLLCVGLVALRYFRLSAAYQESEGRFRALFEQMPDPAWITKGHRFIEANQAALKVMGYNHKADFLSLHPSQLSPELQPDGEPPRPKRKGICRPWNRKACFASNGSTPKRTARSFPSKLPSPTSPCGASGPSIASGVISANANKPNRPCARKAKKTGRCSSTQATASVSWIQRAGLWKLAIRCATCWDTVGRNSWACMSPISMPISATRS